MKQVEREEKVKALRRVRSAAVASAKSRKELEQAVYLAWNMGLPNISIALEAGWNDANIRMLARRRKWRRQSDDPS